MPVTPIRAVLFDKDGTLFSFARSWTGAIRAVLAATVPDDAGLRRRLGLAAGFDPDTGDFAPGAPVVAGTPADVAARWAPLLPDRDPATLAELIERVGASCQTPTPAVADLAGLLDGLRGRGLSLGVATHDSADGARADLGAVGVLDRFGFIAGYDSGVGLKPEPGMVLAFAAAIGAAPGAVAMLGDSPGDLRAARAAGAVAVGVLTGPAGRADLEPLADAVLADIGALPAWLDERAAQSRR
jgi:phosphoglycolate phosphatase